jgi:pimeloyl-ACP methyl ester carboxylesterase
LRAIPGDPRVAAFIGVGVPFASEPPETLPLPKVPALFVVGSEDVYGPPEMLRKWAGDSARIVEVPGADHFLEGKLEELEKVVTAFLEEIGRGSSP